MIIIIHFFNQSNRIIENKKLIDIGTNNNLLFAKNNISRELKKPAIFFDRDGVLIHAPVKNGIPKSSKTLNDIKLSEEIENICNFYKTKFKLIMIKGQKSQMGLKVTTQEERHNYKKSNSLNQSMIKTYLQNNHNYLGQQLYYTNQLAGLISFFNLKFISFKRFSKLATSK